MNEEVSKDIPEKKSRGSLFLTGAIILISWALTVTLLFWMAQIPMGKSYAQGTDIAGTAERFHNNLNNRISDAMAGIVSIKKTYWIHQEVHQAPVPDAECYGTLESPDQLQEVLDQAAELLDGQEFLLGSESKLLEGTQIRYYLDETILAVVWKEAMDGSVYTFAEVKIAHPSQFRRYLAGDAFASGTLLLTTEMAQTVNAVVAGNGDYYAYRTPGVTIWDGTVYRNNRGIPDNCYVTRDGNLLLERGGSFPTAEEAQRFVDENNIQFSLSFGPILVKDGELMVPDYYPVGEITGSYTRAAICQMDKLHYLFVSVNAESGSYALPTIHTFARRILETGCIQGYTLDGGQTATVVMENELVNQVNYGSQRRISDIIYFATAKPKGDGT